MMRLFKIAALFLMANPSMAFERLVLTCDVFGSETMTSINPFQETVKQIRERIQVDIDTFVPPQSRPDIAFLKYKIQVRGSRPASLTLYVPPDGVSKQLNGTLFANESSDMVFEYVNDLGEGQKEHLRIDRTTGLIEVNSSSVVSLNTPSRAIYETTYRGYCKTADVKKRLF